MKNFTVCVLLFFTAISFVKASVTINLDAGILYRDKTGSAPMPTGMLLELIAAPAASNGMFFDPSPGSFTNGNNIVAINFGMNYNSGIAGDTINVLTFNLDGFNAGDPLLLRWYPTISLSGSMPSRQPQAEDLFGQFRSDAGESSGGVQGSGWFVPADGTSVNLIFNTGNAGGIHQEPEGFANFTVSPVPEPSTWAMLGAGVGGLAFVARRRRRMVAVGS